eukprot:3899085-Pyramimonas_sp.AAC.2
MPLATPPPAATASKSRTPSRSGCVVAERNGAKQSLRERYELARVVDAAKRANKRANVGRRSALGVRTAERVDSGAGRWTTTGASPAPPRAHSPSTASACSPRPGPARTTATGALQRAF